MYLFECMSICANSVYCEIFTVNNFKISEKPGRDCAERDLAFPLQKQE